MSFTIKCDNCGKRKHRYKPCEYCGYASGNENAEQSANWGSFAVTDETIDVLGLFLDDDIRMARDKIHQQIENGKINIQSGNTNTVLTDNAVNRIFTPAAKKVLKVVADVQALQKQAQRNRH